MPSIVVFILVLALLPYKLTFCKKYPNRGGCDYLHCDVLTVTDQKYCADFGNTGGYCKCVERDGKKVPQYVPCEETQIFDLKNGQCVDQSLKEVVVCEKNETPKKKKVDIITKIDNKINAVLAG
uniref:Putative 7.8 kDa secreted protein n=1 Tax=Culex tarsalis TaxID=7177 RepID=A0A1Q3EUV5_CULTA